jgi:hypothetical protein
MLLVAISTGTAIAAAWIIHDLQAYAEHYVARRHEND